MDRPVTTRLHVDSRVEHRYAITKVIRDVHNPANQQQQVDFAVVMPSMALVSEVTLRGQKLQLEKLSKIGEKMASASPVRAGDSSEESGPEMEVGSGSRDFIQFVLPVLLEPGERVTLSLVYENILERKSGLYQHPLNLSPGEIIYDLVVKINISENKNVSNVSVTGPVIDQISKFLTLESESQNHTMISFTMTSHEQAENFGSPGFSGTLLTQFDVTDNEQSVDMAIEDGYFVHFYTVPGKLPPIPKHVIAIVDVSQSMRGSLATVSETLKMILESLNSDDYLNIVAFNSSIFQWNPTLNNSLTIVDKAFKCLPQVKQSGLDFVEGLEPSGLSDLVSGLQHAIYTGQKIRSSPDFPDNVFTMIVLLTDGHTTRPEVNTEKRIRIANRDDKVPIYSLAVGPFSQDELLQKISVSSGGSFHKINPDQDLDVQLQGVLKQFDDVVLKNVNIRYADNLVVKESITMTEFKSFKTGTSLVVVGQFNQSINGSIEPVISGQFINGSYTEKQAIFTVPSRRPDAFEPIVINGPDNNSTFNKPPQMLSINKRNHMKNDSSREHLPTNVNSGTGSRNCLERQWAYLKIREGLDDSKYNDLTDPNLVETLVNLSITYNFLTPFIQLVDLSNNTQTIHEWSQLMTTSQDYSGVHLAQSKAATKCHPLIKCRQPFGFTEPLPKVISEEVCLSSLSLTNLNGKSLVVAESSPRVDLVGVAHVSQDGGCCWILYEGHQYEGEKQKFCGRSGPLLIKHVKSARKIH